MLSESALFLKMWLRKPLSMGSVAPSSRSLALAVARQVPQPVQLPVLELGGGTGAVTRALIDVGIPRDKLIVIEREEALYRMLVDRFPGVTIIRGDAAETAALLRAHGIHQVSAVASGLPFASMPRAVVTRVVQQCFEVIAPGGPFIQFTYTWVSQVPRQELGLEGGLRRRVFGNFPPASVWVYHRAADRRRLAS